MTALRLRSFAGRVFRHAVATFRAERDPASVLRGALTTPLVRHHAAILEARLRRLNNPGRYLFPAFHTSLRPMSENTLNAALRRLGYTGEEMTAHGLRATTSTLLKELGRWHPDAIERARA